jgi:hypothetical protein
MVAGADGGNGVTNQLNYDNNFVRLYPMLVNPDAVPSPEASPTPNTRTVVDLLKDNRPLYEIREHIRDCIAPSARELVTSTGKDGEPCNPLNDWIKKQQPATWSERVALTQFINELLALAGLVVEYEGSTCYLSMSKKPRYPEGVIYLVPQGSKRALCSRKDFSSLPDFHLKEANQDASETAASRWVCSLSSPTETTPKTGRN